MQTQERPSQARHTRQTAQATRQTPNALPPSNVLRQSHQSRQAQSQPLLSQAQAKATAQAQAPARAASFGVSLLNWVRYVRNVGTRLKRTRWPWQPASNDTVSASDDKLLQRVINQAQQGIQVADIPQVKEELEKLVLQLQREMQKPLHRRRWSTSWALVEDISRNLDQLPRLITKPAAGACARTITVPQYSGTCWFNALLMALFYSQGMREYLLDNCRPMWKKRLEQLEGSTDPVRLGHLRTLYTTFARMLLRLHTYETDVERAVVYTAFDKMRPEHMLELLHDWDADSFDHNPRATEGHHSELYISQVMQLLGVRKRMHLSMYNSLADADGWCPVTIVRAFTKNNPRIDVDIFHGVAALQWGAIDVITVDSYDDSILTSHGRSLVREALDKASWVLYVRPRPNGLLQFEVRSEGLAAREFARTQDLPSSRFAIDSLVLANFNKEQCQDGHAIAGVTCEGQRYLYNGWTAHTRDPAMRHRRSAIGAADSRRPCTLMEFDWLRTMTKFCISTKECGMQRMREADLAGNQLCFTAGTDRMYIAIRRPALHVRRRSGNSGNSGNSSGQKGGQQRRHKKKYAASKSTLKVTVEKVNTSHGQRRVYTGPRGGRYVRINGKFVRASETL